MMNYYNLLDRSTYTRFKTLQKKAAVLLFFVMFSVLGVNAQVTTNGGSGLSGSYPDLATAITALNAASISSPVVITLGGPETAPAGGYAITATGTSTNTITISGGSNTVTASAAHVIGDRADAIFKIVGGDYITIQNFTMRENGSNTVTAVASNSMTEFGVALFLGSATDGAQNNTIQNNDIALSASYQNGFGVFSTSSFSSTNGVLAATSTAGTNSNNKVYGNTISSVAYGVGFICEPVTATITESGNDVGGSSGATANNITYGVNTSADAAWNRFATGVAGIYYRNGGGFSARFNTLTSNNMTLSTTGVAISTGTAPVGVTYTANISDNIVNITSSAVGLATNFGVQFGTGNATATIMGNNNNIAINQTVNAAASGQIWGILGGSSYISSTMNNNVVTITQSNTGTAVASSGQVVGIGNYASASVTSSTQTANGNTVTLKQNAPSGTGTYTGALVYMMAANGAAIGTGSINSNQFLTTGSTLRTTGAVFGVYHDNTYASFTANANTFTIDRTGAGAITIFHSTTTGVSVALNFTNNIITVTGSMATGVITPFFEQDGLSATGTTKTITGNTININTPSNTSTPVFVSFAWSFGSVSNNSFTVVNAGGITGSTISSSGAGAWTFNNNTYSLTSSGVSPTITGILLAQGSGHTVSNNTFNTLSASAAAASAPNITAISITSTATSPNSIFGNNILNASTGAGSGTATIVGINIAGGNNNIYRNKISDLGTVNTGASSLVSGMRITAGVVNNVYNNVIGNLTNSAVSSLDAIRGINITSTSATSNQNVYNNTIYLNASSSGANFGVAGIYHTTSATATTSALDLRNNIVINTSTPGTTGVVTALRRSTAAALSNFATTSNRNMYFAGTAAANRTIMYDGTNAYQNMGTYFTAVGPTREANSFTDAAFVAGTFFLSTTGSSSDFLRPATGLSTQAESGGSTIALTSPDYAGVTRPASPGTGWDLGAFEFNGTTPAPSVAFVSITPSTATLCTATARLVTVDVQPGAGTITGVVLNYSLNGVAQSAITMTNTTGTTWEATIPAATPVNATVAWSVTATNSIPLTGTYTGTNYADAPNTGSSVVASATSPICDGTSTTLNLTVAAGPNAILGAGGTTSTSTAATFFPGGWGGAKTQYIIRASELTAAGLTAGAITSLSFETGGAAGQTYQGFRVQLGNTAATVMTTTFLSTPMIQVYLGTLANDGYTPANGVNALAFGTGTGSSSTFSWDGTSNIVVSVCWTSVPAASNSTGTSMKVDTVAFTSSAYDQSDLASPATECGTTAGDGTGSSRPKFTFGRIVTPTSISWSDGLTTVGTGNALSVSPTTTTSYTATATLNGCPVTSNTISVTVNPKPTAPTTTDSSQCGNQVPTASVADPNGFTTPTFKWYAASSGGSALQTSTSVTYTTAISTTTTFYVSVISPITGCESNRTAVTVTVATPDAVDASTNDAAICLGESFDLSAVNIAGTPVQNYTYSWSSTAGSGASSPVAGSPATITPTAAGVFVYTVTATDGSCVTTDTVSVTVEALPAITITPSAATICEGSSVSLAGTTAVGGAGNVAIGAGALTTTGSSGSGQNSLANPFNHYFGGQKSEYVIRASELTAAGLSAGNITALSFDITTAGITYNSFSLSLGHTASTVATTTFTASGLTQVFTGNVAVSATGLKTLTFLTPFAWNGTSNIVVQLCWSNVNTGSTGAELKYDTTSYVSTLINRADSQSAAAVCGVATASQIGVGNTLSERPRMVFAGQAAVNTTGSMTWTWNPGALSGPNITVSPIATTTYTATAFNPTTGCTGTKTVVVTVNPQPIAPAGTNSSQCGAGVPTASVMDTNAFTTPVFKWYSASTGGTVLQSSTSTTFTSSIAGTTTFYVAVVTPVTLCESLRTPVTVTFQAADTITITPSTTTTCEDTAFTLGASSANAGYVYTWTANPVAGSGIPTNLVGSSVNITPTSGGTYVYTVSGTDGNCTNTNTVSITVISPTVVTSASPATICAGASTTLTATTPTIGTGNVAVGTSTTTDLGASIYRNGFGTGGFRHQLLYTAAELTAAGLYAGNITGFSVNVASAGSGSYNNYVISMANVAQTALTTTFNTATTAQVFSAATYTPATSGTNTHTFSTPFVWDGTSSVLIDICYTVTTSSGSTTLSVNSNQNLQSLGGAASCTTATGTLLTLRPVLTFAGQTVTQGAGSLVYTWNPGNLSGNVQTVSPTTTTTYTVSAFDSSTGCTATKDVVVTVNPLPTAPTGTDSAQCGPGIPTVSVADPNGFTTPTFKWYADNVTTTALQSSTSTTYTTSISATTTFYVSVTNPTTGCESARTPVTVTYTVPDAIVRNPGATATGCSNQPLVVSVSSANAAYVYTWTASPATGSGIPTSVTGAAPSITPTAGGVYTYTISAVGGGCTTSTTIVATITNSPSAITITPTGSQCLGQVRTLTAAGGTISNASMFSETFDSGLGGFVATSTGSTSVLSKWGPQANGYSYLETFSGSTNGFAFSNHDAPGSGSSSNETLTSPSFNTLGATGLSFQMKEYFRTTNETVAAIEISDDNFTTVTVLRNALGASIGSPTGFNSTSIVIPAQFENKANVKIRFRYASAWGYYWAIDEVKVVGSVVPSMVWTPSTELYSDATATTAYAGQSATVVYAKVTTARTYTATATSNGCSTLQTITVTPLALPVFSVAPATICGGGSGILLSVVSGEANSYLWSPAAGLSATSGSSVTANPSATTTYTVTATNNTTGCQSQQTVIVTVNNPVILSGAGVLPLNPTAIVGQTVTFTAAASGTGLTYQWYENGNLMSGETGSTLAVLVTDTEMNGNLYHVVISGTAPCASATSSDATLTVDTTGITDQPDDVTVCAPNGASFTVVATSEDLEPEEIVYGWEVDYGSGFVSVIDGADATISGYTFSGADTNVLTLTSTSATQVNWLFHAVVNGLIFSDDATLAVNAPVVITGSPSDQTVCVNGATTFTAAGTASGDLVTYQWQVSTNGGGSWSNLSNGPGVSGATLATLSLSNIAVGANGNQYRAIVSPLAPCGSQNTLAATLTVINPLISVQPPVLTTVVQEQATTIAASATGATTYQWTFATTLGGTYTALVEGATVGGNTYTTVATPTLHIATSASSVADNAYFFKLVASNGTCSVTSNAGQLNITTYCAPPGTTFTSSGGESDSITNATITNVTESTSINQDSSGAVAPWYTFYQNEPLNVTQGQSMSTSMTFSTDGTQHSAIWIDFNQNGVFEASENVALSSSAAGGLATVTYNFTIPLTATPGITRIRLRGGSDGAYTAAGACATTAWGEVEDYLLNIVLAPACSGTPVAGTVTSAGGDICNSGTATLTVAGYTSAVTGINLQWYDGATNLPIGAATGASYTTPVLTSGHTYFVRVTCANSGLFADASFTVIVNNPTVNTTVPATRCGAGSVTLSATGSAGATLDWYATASGGTSLFTGASFATPVITTTTDYYVAASNGGSIETIGKLSSPGTDGSFIAAGWGVVFNATAPITINSTVIYPTGTGTVVLAVVNSAGTELAATAAIPVTGTGIATPVTVPVNIAVPPGTGYRLLVKSFTGISNLIRDFSGLAFPYAGVNASVTGGWNGSATATNYFFYNLSISTGCFSARTMVTATVTPAPALTISSAGSTICAGSTTIVPVTITSPLGNFDTYTWSPAIGVTGNSTSGYFFSATSTTTFTLTGTNSSSGCANIATYTLTVTPLPNAISISPNAVSQCVESPAVLLTIETANPTPVGGCTFADNNGQWPTSTFSTATCNGTTANILATNCFAGEYSLMTVTAATKYVFTSTGGSDIVTISDASGGTILATGPSPITWISPTAGQVRFYTHLTSPVCGEDSISRTRSFTCQPAAGAVFSPITGLYTNAGATIAYTGTVVSQVYAKPTSTQTYTATVTASGCSVSATATVTIKPVPTATAPSTMDLCAGMLTTPVALAGTPSGVTFDISGGASVGLSNQANVTSIPAFTAIPGNATVTVTPKANGCTGNAVTFLIKVSPPTVGGSLSGGTTICAGSSSALLTLSGHTGNVIRWESSVSPFSVWSPIANTATTYTSGALTQTTQFRAVVQSGTCQEVASSATTVTVNVVTLASVTASDACPNTMSIISLNGMAPNSTSTVGYTKSGVGQAPVSVTASASGVGSFSVLISAAGQTIVITSITRTDVSPNCPFTPTSGNSATPVFSTQCSQVQTCGITLPTIDTQIVANLVANAQGYRWRVTNLTGPNTSQVQTTDTPLRTMKLTNLPSYAFATQYNVEVATLRNGVWGPFSSGCTVVTPSATTNLTNCNLTLTTLGDVVYANIVPFAGGYRFRITDPVNATNTQVIERPIREFKMTMITAFAVQYGKTYNVEVGVKNTDGTYMAYGTVCQLSTPVFPTTSLQDSQCEDYMVPSATTQIYAFSYPGAIGYAFLLTGPGLPVAGVEVVKPVRTFSLSDFAGAGLIPGATYNVKVRLIFNLGDPAGPYGKTCTIVTPGAGRIVESKVQFNAIAFPNPFAEDFSIEVATSLDQNIGVKVYDMTGRLLETREVKISDIESLQIGQRYPSGVYNVIVTQGDNVKTLRVIKR
jgi:hypothetical protein